MSADLAARIGARLAALAPGWPRVRIVVAFSGGIDSVVLLHALLQLRRQPALRGKLRLRAVHVDHHLQAVSGDWSAHCALLARRWRVPLVVRDAQIRLQRGASLEAAARDARYALLAEELQAGELLLTAQHQDDQLETVLLQLLRGAGAAGLAAMPEAAAFGAGQLLRPLLPVSRSDIRRYAESNKLAWIDDPSNADPRFDRNYLRARVLPALLERWPAAAATVSRSARHMAEAQALIGALARIDLATLVQGRAMVLQRLLQLSPSRQSAAVRGWLEDQGCRMPDAVHLERILRELPAARVDANPLVRWSGGEVRRYGGMLVCVPAATAAPNAGNWHWRRQSQFDLGTGWGSLCIVPSLHGPWLRRELPAKLVVGYRVGGERLMVAGHRRTLKELLRSSQVLPWLRGRVPVVSSGDEVWCVPALWSRAGVAGAAARGAARVAIEWRDAPLLRLPQLSES